MMKVPEVERCCCCCPLRQGILVFGIINIIFSIAAVAWLVFTTELKKAKFIDGSLEVVTSTVLFSIFGMSVILNILLLVAGCQVFKTIGELDIFKKSESLESLKKDITMLRLFNCYAVATALAALVPTFILMSRAMYYDTGVALSALAIQCYVILLVRSEVVKLELKLTQTTENRQQVYEEAIDVGDGVTLL